MEILQMPRAIPKADRHAHAYFSADIEAVEGWLGRRVPRAPAKMDGLQGMHAYAAAALDPYINTHEGYTTLTRRAVEAQVEDGVVVLEMSFDIRSTAHFERGLPGFLAFILSLVEGARGRLDFRPELGFPRTITGDRSLTDLALQAIGSDVFQSIDMYSNESACPPEAVVALYDAARKQGMKLKAHVGEFGGPEEVRRNVEVLQLDEVQHGIAAAESPEVMDWLRESHMRLNVCPTSNVMLDAVSDIALHPIRILFDRGVRVTVNTDDRMIFGQSVSQEYLNLYSAGVFSAQELDTIRVASLE